MANFWKIIIAALLEALTSAAARAAIVEVRVLNYSFEPQTVDVRVGDTVRWRWVNGSHTLTSGASCRADGRFDLPATSDAVAATYTFRSAGDFAYFCRPHCSYGMRGTVQVRGNVNQPPEIVTDPVVERIEPARLAVRLAPISGPFATPVSAAILPSQPKHLWVADSNGLIWDVHTRSGSKFVAGDLRAWLGTTGPGLQSLAFASDREFDDVRLYTLAAETPRSRPVSNPNKSALTAADYQQVIREWRIGTQGDGRAYLDPLRQREILRIEPVGGTKAQDHLAVGPDGLLYISVAAGSILRSGLQDTPGEDALNSLHGKILRIDPAVAFNSDAGYSIPDDNPFRRSPVPVSESCDDGICDEIYASGFRHITALTFKDRQGQLLSSDRGVAGVQEINLISKGGDYGWPGSEGNFCLRVDSASTPVLRSDCTANGIAPLAQYDRDEGVGIVGGRVYHGASIPKLRGRYVFADAGLRGQQPGRLFYVERRQFIAGRGSQSHSVRALHIANRQRATFTFNGFAVDSDGELLVLANRSNRAAAVSGVVLRLRSR